MKQKKFDFTPYQFSKEERECFPIYLEPDFDYPRVDRIAGFWMGLGLKVEIKTESTAGYILILDLPD